MSDNSVQTDLLTNQRIQHNLEVRKSGIKYWGRTQQQSWNQFCIDEQVTDRIKTNSFHLEWPLATSNGSKGSTEANEIDHDGLNRGDQFAPTTDNPIDSILLSNNLIDNYPISTTFGTDPGPTPQSDSINIWLPQPQTEPAEQNAIQGWVCAVAKKPETPAAVLRSLSTNPSVDVRIAVADNPSTSNDILFDLAGDSNSAVRYAMAQNHNIPSEVLEILSVDADPCVAGRACRTMERLIPTNQSRFLRDNQ